MALSTKIILRHFDFVRKSLIKINCFKIKRIFTNNHKQNIRARNLIESKLLY